MTLLLLFLPAADAAVSGTFSGTYSNYTAAFVGTNAATSTAGGGGGPSPDGTARKRHRIVIDLTEPETEAPAKTPRPRRTVVPDALPDFAEIEPQPAAMPVEVSVRAPGGELQPFVHASIPNATYARYEASWSLQTHDDDEVMQLIWHILETT